MPDYVPIPTKNGLDRASLWLLGLLLAMQAGMLAYSAKAHSPTWDEVGHYAAGLGHWTFGSFELYSVNPPLVRTVAAAPVAFFCRPDLDWRDRKQDPKQRSEVLVGRRLIEANKDSFLWHFTVARWACIPFPLLGTIVVFLWSKSLFGSAAGLLGGGTWVFSPLVLGHGSLITPDVGAASIGVAFFYCFRLWLLRPSWGHTCLLGTLAAWALLCKSTWIVIPPIVILCWLGWSWSSGENRSDGIDKLCKLCVAGFVACVLFNAFYAFDGFGKKLGDFEFVSQKLSGRTDTMPNFESDNRFRSSWAENIPVPLPAAFVNGLDIQSYDFEQSARDRKSYMLGQWRQGGWWYYYLIGIAVKEPLPWLLLLGLTGPLVLTGTLPGCPFREFLLLAIPPLAILLLVSSQSSISAHIRYALPALPFLHVWTSQCGRLLSFPGQWPGIKWLPSLVALCLLWLVVGTIRHSPHWISWFNELAGGPKGGWRVLDNSNIDWGQDLLHLQDWMIAHPDESQNMKIAYFGCFDPSMIGIEFKLPPPLAGNGMRRYWKELGYGPEPGWYAVSVNYVLGSDMPVPDGHNNFIYWGAPAYQYFKRFTPVDRAGHSILIYHLKPNDVYMTKQTTGGDRNEGL